MAILAESPAAAPVSPSLASLLRAGLWLLPAGRAVRDCGDVVRAGGIAWQALVPGGAGHRLGGFSGGWALGKDAIDYYYL
ncbi:MAG: hypothetical protein PHS80_10715 [Methanothrix sp.]|nr:hypothetical protein [Methanothrix sp.]MDD4447661.1 hypothetical protein [Methanothrix sp.]